MRADIHHFLYKERRWWRPLRALGWAYAYGITLFAFLVCIGLTLGILLKILGY